MNNIETTIQTITTTIITNIKGLTLTIMSFILMGTVLSLLAILEQYYILGVTTLFVFWFSPLIFMKQIRKNFVTDVVINFYHDYFSLALFDRQLFEMGIENKLKYSELSSLTVIESTKDDSSFLKLYHKDGTKSIYRFLDQKYSDTNVVPILLNLIKSYNGTSTEAEKIHFRKSLFASNFGFYCIVCLRIMLISIIILGLIYKPDVIPISLLPSLSLYFYIITQRKKDLEVSKILD